MTLVSQAKSVRHTPKPPMAPPNLPTLLLFLFRHPELRSLPSPRPPHPFRNLPHTSIIKSFHLASSKLLAFHYVGLDKPDVLAWQSDRRAALPRRVFVIARADGQTHELYIDISNNNSITSDKICDGFGYPMVNVEEIDNGGLRLAFQLYAVRGVGEEERVGAEGRGVPRVHRWVVWGGEARDEAGKLAGLRDGRHGEPLHEAYGGREDIGGFGCHGDCGV